VVCGLLGVCGLGYIIERSMGVSGTIEKLPPPLPSKLAGQGAHCD
jgi:hypothetical protein